MLRRAFRVVGGAATACTVGLAAAAPAGPAAGAATTLSCPAPLAPASTVSPPGGRPFVMCSGRIPSFDGTPLDADLSLPEGAAGPLPLMVMLHGWGSSKTEWEAASLAGNATNQYHWNNAWFASQGYAVLTYSARGFHRSCGQDPSTGYTYATDPACAGRASWTHLADRRWEIHDLQYLVGLLVDAGIASPDKVVVTGDSYGGGQSWELALSQDMVVSSASTDPNQPLLTPWRSPRGVPIRLLAAVPQFPWTDLAAALQQNGRASDGFFGAPPPGPDESPIGVEKESYVDGLYGLGASTAQYAPPGRDQSADLTTWYGGVSAGEPYAANPEAQSAVTEIGGAFRSPYAMPVPPPRYQVPVFDVQGLTDPLFPAIQALQEVNRLEAAYPGYPVWTFYGDIGHAYADNPAAVWQRANDEANTWLSRVLAGTPTGLPRVTVATIACESGQSLTTSSADRFQEIPSEVLHLSSAQAATTVSASAVEPEGEQTDPIANGGCRTMSAETDPNVAAWTFPSPQAVTLLGSPIVRTTVSVEGTDAEIAARLWDVDPAAGTQTLVTRTVYRIEEPAPGETVGLAFELFPTAWQVLAGHALKLEVTQDDAPAWRPDNLPSSLTFAGIHLDLPAAG